MYTEKIMEDVQLYKGRNLQTENVSVLCKENIDLVILLDLVLLRNKDRLNLHDMMRNNCKHFAFAALSSSFVFLLSAEQ